MEIYGVCNASPDSLNTDSIVVDAVSAVSRAQALLAAGAQKIDIGGQGSTHVATEVDADVEWSRLAAIVPAVRSLGVDVSVDTWRPTVMRRALEHGATVMNAADALQADGMMALAAEFGCPVVLPFMIGPDPLHLEHVQADSPPPQAAEHTNARIGLGAAVIDVMVEWFEMMLKRCDAFGIRDQIIIDPGTGFAPLGWEWESRYHYQKHVYSNLDRLRAFGLPLYIALPWRETAQHEELLRIVLRADVEYGRAHYPAHIREVEREVKC